MGVFSSTRSVMLTAALWSLVAAAPTKAHEPECLPVAREDALFYFTPRTVQGDALRLYTDTGGGLFLIKGEVERLGGEIRTAAGGGFEGRLPALSAPAGAPLLRDWLPAMDVTGAPEGSSAATARNDRLTGMVGARWFADQIWTFDYARGELLLHTEAPDPAPGARVEPIYFQLKDGARTMHFPRIGVVVDGERLDLLFDTGAQTPLSPDAMTALGVGRSLRATSFISKGVYERWRARHPEWRVIERAEAGSGAAMIEVASVKVAGFDTGPVWFTVRPDASFTGYMSQWMDQPVVGALGGSALRYFRVTVDYPQARAIFEPAASPAPLN